MFCNCVHITLKPTLCAFFIRFHSNGHCSWHHTVIKLLKKKVGFEWSFEHGYWMRFVWCCVENCSRSCSDHRKGTIPQLCLLLGMKKTVSMSWCKTRYVWAFQVGRDYCQCWIAIRSHSKHFCIKKNYNLPSIRLVFWVAKKLQWESLQKKQIVNTNIRNGEAFLPNAKKNP